MIKYLLRGCKYLPDPTNKPDGMMVRHDGWWTDNKAAAKLFDSILEAETFYMNVCMPLWRTNNTHKVSVWVVETEVKFIADKISKQAVKAL